VTSPLPGEEPDAAPDAAAPGGAPGALAEPGTLVGWFARAVAVHPDGCALVAPGGQRSFRELDAAAGALAAAVRTAVGGRPARVAVFGERTADTFEAYLAALYAGATVVPLSPEMPDARNVRIARDAGVDALLFSSTARGIDGATLGAAVAAAVPGVALVDVATAARDGYLRSTEAGLADQAYLVFTSGSTGRPKGVPISHGNIDAYLRAVADRFRPSPADVFSQLHELTFDYSVFELWVAWSGAARVSAAPRIYALDPAKLVRRRGITFLCATPSTVEGVLGRGGAPAGSMPGVRYLVCSGEPLRETTARAWSAAAPDAVLDNLYGPTELTVTCTGYRWRPGVRDEADTVPIGVLNPGMEHVLLDAGGAPADEGELCVRGPQMFAGYLDPADDAGRFAEVDGQRYYRTGDRIGRGADGLLRHLGRVDDQVKVRGYRVELHEVEAAVRRVTGGAAMAADVPSEGETSLVVFVTGAADFDPARVRAQLAGTLPPYMVPAQLHAVAELPVNRHGKADRAELRRRAAALLTPEVPA
jgi:amino acid adenylation domain-containing protein